MSMPIISASNISRCDAITDIIESVALQQTGLSHILNAEGEKIQAALKTAESTDSLLKVNASVNSMVNSITRLEVILQSKLELFKDCICQECDCVIPITNLVLSNAEAGTLSSEGKNIYLYKGSSLGNNIIFEVEPKVSVTPITELPKGITFDNYTLNIPEKFDFSIPYSMEFMIGTNQCKYVVTINTAVI